MFQMLLHRANRRDKPLCMSPRKETFRSLIQKKFLELKSKNPSYSLRAYSKKLGISSGALSEIIDGKRNISRKMTIRISERLLLSPTERGEFLNPFQWDKLKDDGSVKLSQEQFKFISEWQHFAILSLIHCDDFKSDILWISKRLNQSPNQIRRFLNTLLELNLIQYDQNGTLCRTYREISTSDEILNLSIQKSHLENLELARHSVENDSIEKRDFTSVTMAVDPKRLSKAKKLIRKFQDDMLNLLETSSKTEVYRLCIQLFPLTKINQEHSSP